MSDSAFKSAPYAGYTTRELIERAAYATDSATTIKMEAELKRRERVAAGDTSVMTDGERLRHAQTGKAR